MTDKSVNSEITKNLKRIKQFIRRAEKRGYIFDDDIIPQQNGESQTEYIERLKQTKPDVLYSKAINVSRETGEILEGIEARKQERSELSKKSAQTRKQMKQAEQQFWSGSSTKASKKNKEQSQQAQTVLPTKIPESQITESEIANAGETVYYNVLNDLINKLSTPTPQTTIYGSKRLQENIESSEDARYTLRAILAEQVSIYGKAHVGYNLEQRADEITPLIWQILTDSDGERIQIATHKLAEIIQGTPLTMQQLAELSLDEDESEDFYTI
jgi:hypothetical protein